MAYVGLSKNKSWGEGVEKTETDILIKMKVECKERGGERKRKVGEKEKKMAPSIQLQKKNLCMYKYKKTQKERKKKIQSAWHSKEDKINI